MDWIKKVRAYKGLLTGCVALVPVLLLSGSVQAAGSATMTVTAEATASTGTVVPVTIYETGDAVNVVTADLSYDQSQLQFVNVDATSSGFKAAISSSGGSGSIDVTRYATDDSGNPTTLNGRQVIAIANFKVIGTAGTTVVSTAASSIIASNGQNIWDGVTNSATIVVGTSLATASPAVTMTPTLSPSPTVTPTPSPTAATPLTVTKTIVPISTTQSSKDSQHMYQSPKRTLQQTSNTAYFDRIAGTSLLLGAIICAIFLILRRRHTVHAQKKRLSESK